MLDLGFQSMSAPIFLLKDGTEQAQGKRQIISNIQACQVVADAVRTTLGPRGMDKLITEGSKTIISNDGATILKKLDIVLPAAKTLVDIAKSQDAEVGDGTTTVVVLAAELLKNAKPFIEDGLHPQIVIKAYRKAAQLATDKLKQLANRIEIADAGKQREMLIRCASTTLSSKLVANQKEYFAEMVVEAVCHLGESLPISMIGIKKVHGGALEESRLVKGVAFKKTFSYAGFEMQPKQYTDKVKIALLNIELELKAEKDNAEMRIQNVEDYQQIVDAEWQILYDKLQKLHDVGVNVVLSKLPIGDVATQWFADRNMFCAGRVEEGDLTRTMESCGGSILTSVSQIIDSNLAECRSFEEMQIGNERYNIFLDGVKSKAVTLILRGGAEQFIDETERSLHDAICIVRRALKNDSVVAGGGAIEMELSRYIREVSRSIAGKEQLLLAAFARAFEIIPQQLCYNAGMDATDLLNKLRQRHAQGQTWIGIDIAKESLADNMEACVWEPVLIKHNAIMSAAEAACIILSVDQTIKNPRAKAEM